ncbi:MAG: metal-dependent hydrolase [Lentisphaeria bacterium]|nr:metal-dependent hydrolase [Lentisphaeria bacterium]
MANFKQHLTGGLTIGCVNAVVGFSVAGLSIAQSVITFLVTVLGSILPDIDSDTSKPVQMLFGYLGAILPIFIIGHLPEHGARMETIVLTSLCGYLVIRYFVAHLFFKFTEHRGIVHSIPFAIFVGLIIYYLFHQSSFVPRLAFAIATFLGYITHLSMDEIWSVDLLGIRIKKSFGSALAWTAPSFLSTALIYLAIISLLGFIFYDYNQVINPFFKKAPTYQTSSPQP